MAKHPSVEHVLQFFMFEHLLEPLRSVSAEFAALATKVANLPPDPEVTTALRKLLEAKDCAVRVLVSARNAERIAAGSAPHGAPFPRPAD